MGKQSVSPNDHTAIDALIQIGEHIRALRKAGGYTAAQAAAVAGISRVTLHRIEGGEAGVAIGAYAAVLAALGSRITTIDAAPAYELPEFVYVDDYPVLRSMAWQLREGILITPAEAWQTYNRNPALLETSMITANEGRLLRLLKRKFGESHD